MLKWAGSNQQLLTRIARLIHIHLTTKSPPWTCCCREYPGAAMSLWSMLNYTPGTPSDFGPVPSALLFYSPATLQSTWSEWGDMASVSPKLSAVAPHPLVSLFFCPALHPPWFSPDFNWNLCCSSWQTKLQANQLISGVNDTSTMKLLRWSSMSQRKKYSHSKEKDILWTSMFGRARLKISIRGEKIVIALQPFMAQYLMSICSHMCCNTYKHLSHLYYKTCW